MQSVVKFAMQCSLHNIILAKLIVRRHVLVYDKSSKSNSKFGPSPLAEVTT